MKKGNPTILLISIHAEYADKIFTSQKTVELRKIRPKRLKEGDWVVVYVTSPNQTIKGIFEVEKIVENPPRQLWNNVRNKAGIKKEEFDKYYQNTNIGVAIYIKKTLSFPNPISLREIQKYWSSFRPPQSYKYVTKDELNLIEDMTKINILDWIGFSQQLSLNI